MAERDEEEEEKQKTGRRGRQEEYGRGIYERHVNVESVSVAGRFDLFSL